ncbi:hypothetical protein GQ44DRAFT_709794 [Phaeosphaeriaceae sp. PMI808]|nr:hypothetical protein GQ44DRAFT_709794 [Phaeosphaeriaceae sp. PMI808]
MTRTYGLVTTTEFAKAGSMTRKCKVCLSCQRTADLRAGNIRTHIVPRGVSRDENSDFVGALWRYGGKW